MHPQTKLIGELLDGTLRAVTVNSDGSIRTTGGSSSGGGSGDASAALQQTMVERLIEVRDRLTLIVGQTDTLEALITSLNSYVDGFVALQTTTNATATSISGFVDSLEGYTDGIESNQATEIARLVEIRDACGGIQSRLPATIGTKTAALSLPVTLSSDGAFVANFGARDDTAATTDTGTFSFLQFLKRLLSIKLPSTLVNDRFKVESQLLSTARTTALINTSTNGTIAAGASSIAIANIGSSAGTVKGVSLPAGASISWSANGNDVLDSINYSATSSNFLITTVT